MFLKLSPIFGTKIKIDHFASFVFLDQKWSLDTLCEGVSMCGGSEKIRITRKTEMNDLLAPPTNEVCGAIKTQQKKKSVTRQFSPSVTFMYLYPWLHPSFLDVQFSKVFPNEMPCLMLPSISVTLVFTQCTLSKNKQSYLKLFQLSIKSYQLGRRVETFLFSLFQLQKMHETSIFCRK